MEKIFCVETIQGLDFEYERIVGYFLTLDGARKVVEENRCDIHENCYDYAIVEEVKPGLYPGYPDDIIIFYKWDRKEGKYVEIDRPTEWTDYCGFTIG